MTDGRKYNRPPPHQRALSDEALETMRSMRALGVPQTKIAAHLGVDVRTVAAAVHGRGAYANVPRQVADNAGDNPTRKELK